VSGWKLSKPQLSYSFFDFDNTIYKGQSNYLILDFSTCLEANGFFDSVEFEKLKSLFSSYYQGWIDRHDFGVLVVESYYRGLSGQTEMEISNQAHQYWDRIQEDAWFPYTIPLLKLINRMTTPVMVSGSPFEVLEIIHKTLGFKELFASKGLIQDGVYTGHTEKEMATFTAKAKLMQELSEALSFEPATSFAFGDSESDFPLLMSVDPRNAYLLGATTNLKKQVVDKNWNLLINEKEILNNVNSRITTLFPE
jgi:HAD superfamily phosphoserine phosphatase-like hydrolase